MHFAKSLPALLCLLSRYFKIVEDNGVDKYTPCSQLDASAEAIIFNELPHDQISAPELSHVVFFPVFKLNVNYISLSK